MASRVYCYYKADQPFLRLAPFKVEILRYEPLVVLFKNVVSDAEIEVVQKLATPRVSVKRALNFLSLLLAAIIKQFCSRLLASKSDSAKRQNRRARDRIVSH